MNQDEALVTAVADYPGLFDATHENYKDIAMKRNSWQQIAPWLKMNDMIILSLS